MQNDTRHCSSKVVEKLFLLDVKPPFSICSQLDTISDALQKIFKRPQKKSVIFWMNETGKQASKYAWPSVSRLHPMEPATPYEGK